MRKHAGGAGEGGFAIALPTLFEKSGAEGPYRRFKFEIAKIAEKNGLPGYNLTIEGGTGRKEPQLRMVRADGKILPTPSEADIFQNVTSKQASDADQSRDQIKLQSAKKQEAPLIDASAFISKTLVGFSNNATRGFMTDATIGLLRGECPGWDLYNLHAEFEKWVGADPQRTPVNWQKAFIGYVRRWHAQHKHELRR